MAKLEAGLLFTGSLGGLSAYKMKGSDKIILRHGWGPGKKQIRTSAKYERTRENITEFSGRSVAARYLRRALGQMYMVADHNLITTMQPLLRKVQLADTTSERGKRNVCLKSAPHLLGAYSLNKHTRFDSIIRSPLICQVDGQSGSASVVWPALIPGITFFPHTHLPVFRLVVALGVMPGVYYQPTGYRAPREYDQLWPAHYTSEWHFMNKGAAENTVQLQLPVLPGDDHCLVLTAGIFFGTVEIGGVMSQQRHAGAARVVAVG